MQDGRPSFTAMYVAFARAVATYDRELSRVCDDHFAELLLPHALGNVISAAKTGGAADVIFAALRASSLGFVDHLALRTRIIDDAVSRASEAGAKQLVLLGAGLDARAHRLTSLKESCVFEVDFPSTQAVKKRQAGQLPRTAGEVRYAACDFERTQLADALREIGFDATRPSLWLWEGVTMYRAPENVAASLATIAALSSDGSSLIATYVTPELALYAAPFATLVTGLLSAVAEPLRASFAPSDMRSLLRGHGFAVESDILPRDTCERYGVTAAWLSFAMPSEHIVVARRWQDTPSPSAPNSEDLP